MSEPAKDTAIEITPNLPVPVASRVQSIVANINRASSRVGGRNKKEEDHDYILSVYFILFFPV